MTTQERSTVNEAGYAAVHRFRVAADPDGLRDSDLYQEMRTQINGRLNPLRGGADWAVVKQLAERIALEDGADLLTAVYYATAACKTCGIAGLAIGLELLLLVYNNSRPEGMPAEKCREIVNWMVSRVTPEVKAVSAGADNLRDLYRCEYSCQQIFELFKERQPDQMPNLETLGFQIFEKLDTMQQTRHKAVLQQPQTITVQALGGSRWRGGMILVGSVCIAVLLLFDIFGPGQGKMIRGFTQWLQTLEINQAQADQPPAKGDNRDQTAHGATLSGLLERFYRQAGDLDIAALQPQHQQYLAELDKSYQRFARARTRLANLSRMARQLQGDTAPIQQLKAQSRQLDEYASSLSPLLGRLYYIQDQIAQKQLQRAMTELQQLDHQLQGVLIKRVYLQHGLSGGAG